jgi:hypothetical protein
MESRGKFAAAPPALLLADAETDGGGADAPGEGAAGVGAEGTAAAAPLGARSPSPR